MRLSPSKYPTVVLLGDSITAQNQNSSAHDAPSSTGYFTFAQMMLCGLPELVYLAGHGGYRTDQLVPLVDTEVLPYAPSFCVVQGGGNDVSQGLSSAAIIASLTSIYEALASAGIRTVATTIMPTTSANTAGKVSALVDTNSWIQTYAAANDMIYCDWYTPLATSSTSGQPASGMTSDGVHPVQKGATLAGIALGNALLPYVPTYPGPINGNARTGRLSTNYLLSGDSSGLATSWTLTSGTWTIVPSKVGRPSNLGQWQQLVISGSDTTAWTLYYRNSTSEWSVGDEVYAAVEFETSGASVGVTNQQAFFLYLNAVSGSDAYMVPHKSSSPSVDAPDTVLSSGVIVAGPFTVPSGTTAIDLQLSGFMTGTVRFGRPSLWANVDLHPETIELPLVTPDSASLAASSSGSVTATPVTPGSLTLS